MILRSYKLRVYSCWLKFICFTFFVLKWNVFFFSPSVCLCVVCRPYSIPYNVNIQFQDFCNAIRFNYRDDGKTSAIQYVYELFLFYNWATGNKHRTMLNLWFCFIFFSFSILVEFPHLWFAAKCIYLHSISKLYTCS